MVILSIYIYIFFVRDVEPQKNDGEVLISGGVPKSSNNGDKINSITRARWLAALLCNLHICEIRHVMCEH